MVPPAIGSRSRLIGFLFSTKHMYSASQNERKMLELWEKLDAFNRSVNERPESEPYVFYDGPPFATGLPHYGHIVAGTMKDTVPRYWTMKGKRVERKWGWDCHGLPIENLVEKELKLPGKKEIEDLGVDKFNEACRGKVLQYAEDWKKIVHRLGRWVDMDNDYKTMDKPFMESVWWVFSELWKKGCVYEGKKAMHVCPRCATPLSNFEVSQGYKDIKDLSVTAKFKVTELTEKMKLNLEGEEVFILAWTTTPWTLPGNILLAVGEGIEYTCVKSEGSVFVVAKELMMDAFEGKEYEVLCQQKGKELVGAKYEPLFDYFKDTEGIENGYRVVSADFVTTDSGTGIVHIAPAFGDDDYQVFKKEGVPFIQHVTIDGRFVDEVKDFAGMEVKQKDDHMATDIEVVKWLAHNGKLFSKKKYEHSYPHCWRCDTPLLNYATSSWFVEVPKVKEKLLENNQKINWVPNHIKDGRFGDWLEGARDWAVSRNRYWGAPLPVWKSEDGDVICVGSVAELEELSGEKVDDLHKHFVDKITFEKDGKTYTRTPEVFDCWFESGSMPYGQMHYPFENKEKFEAGFPAQFIAEGQDQTRGWFYTLHVLSTMLTMGDNPSIPSEKTHGAFKNVIVNGMVMAEDGKKMSKRLQNYPDPMEVVEKYGADALRFYLLSSPVMHAENLNFAEDGVREVFNKLVNTLWNVVTFYEMFADEYDHSTVAASTGNILDKWILARLASLTEKITEEMDSYHLAEASRPLQDFTLELSQWFVRRSRDRVKGEDQADKAASLATLRHVLVELSKLLAPFTPFVAELTYQAVAGDELKECDSVHLAKWPEVNKDHKDEALEKEMDKVRKVVEMGMSLRKEHGQKVRQVLSDLTVSGFNLPEGAAEVIADEMNVKSVNVSTEKPKASENLGVREDGNLVVALNLELTEELESEGAVRELVRAVNGLRKAQGLTRDDRVKVFYSTESDRILKVIEQFGEELKSQVLADSLEAGKAEESLNMLGGEVRVGVDRV